MVSRLFKRVLDSYPCLRVLAVGDRRTENRLRELGMIAQAMEFAQINQVRGDYFEFGLWQGKTFKYAHKMMRRYSLEGMKLRGFDSFCGLPAHENRRYNIWSEGQFACTREELTRELSKAGFKPDDYELVPGFYHESLNQRLVERLRGEGVHAAVVYVDCDLYESTCEVLRFVSHFFQNGTIVCFDDYYNYKAAPDEGEARALGEFVTQYPRFQFRSYMQYAPLGQSFIVRVASEPPQ